MGCNCIRLKVSDDETIRLTPHQEVQIIEAISPVIDVEETDEGIILTITDVEGEKQVFIPVPYAATEEEIQEIIDSYTEAGHD